MTNRELKKCITCTDLSICGGTCTSANLFKEREKSIKENIHKQEIEFTELKDVVTVIQKSYDSFIFDELGRACHKVGVSIDENKLKEWLKMCSQIELMSPEANMETSKELEYQSLKEEIEYLRYKLKSMEEV